MPPRRTAPAVRIKATPSATSELGGIEGGITNPLNSAPKFLPQKQIPSSKRLVPDSIKNFNEHGIDHFKESYPASRLASSIILKRSPRLLPSAWNSSRR